MAIHQLAHQPARALTVLLIAASGIAAGLLACGGEAGTPEIGLMASRRTVCAGQRIDLYVVAYDVEGNLGTGQVTLRVSAGTLERAESELTLPLVNGRTGAQYACDRSLDPACDGVQIVSAAWNGRTTTLNVAVSECADAGHTP
ncbi:MAG: hypothetical protein HY901_03045 [Deltaproteobacteria bacterium]|nr:hypothetical protein [Deltaproteobacteria bacterium]